MSAAQLVIKEICNSATQRDLHACRRSLAYLGGGPVRTRKQDLADDLMEMARCPRNRESIGMGLLSGRDTHSLRLLIARLKGLGCLVPVGSRARKDDLLAAIMHTAEYAPRRVPTAPVTPTAGPMAPAPPTDGPGPPVAAAPTNGKGLCPGPPVVAASTTLVAYGTAAEPARMERKLTKTWRKKWAKLCKKKARKDKLAKVKMTLQGALDDATATTTVGDLRAIVGRTLGITLEGRNQLAFDMALSELTAPPPKKKRRQTRFRVANKRERAARSTEC